MCDALDEEKAGGKEWLLLPRRSQSRSRAFLHSFRSASSQRGGLVCAAKVPEPHHGMASLQRRAGHTQLNSR